MRYQREVNGGFWFTKPGVVGASIFFSRQYQKWVFRVPHPTQSNWARIEHRHPTREAAEAEGTTWAVIQALETS